ncbi:GtrA family protein [Clostridium cagae]|uniref:GtrA family protein n=1 Tax=Clostridium cagae TaxID=2080751 RepID=UPI003F766AE4
MYSLNKVTKQFLKFILISGTGWVIDFSIYYIITSKLGLYVGVANVISAIPAITFVFIVSTKKIFSNTSSKFSLPQKYLIYFLYQIILISLISSLAQIIFNIVSITTLMNELFIANNLEMLVKIFITPITMTINFFIMKILSEKL